jgi:iron(III) transport system substrate-binding protein
MVRTYFCKPLVISVALTCAVASTGLAASADLLQAKKRAESTGYVFFTSHEDIVEKAKKEGKVHVLGSLDADSLKALNTAFRKKYPFIESQVQEIAGQEVYMRMIQEMKSGLAKDWDVNYLAFDLYDEYLPYQKKFDILGMAQHQVLQIPVKMIDPKNRHVVVVASDIQVVAYNRKNVPPEKVPNAWTDFLKEEFKGKKFMLDLRPKDVAALIPAWGLEKTLDFASKLAAQKPVWVRGNSRAMPMVQSGETNFLFGPNYSSVLRAQDKGVGTLAHKIIEPVPTRLNEAQGILNTARHPHAALLWLEFICSSEGQQLIDKHEPYGASILSPGSAQEKATRGLKLSMVDWDHVKEMEYYQKKIVEAYGFPRADR